MTSHTHTTRILFCDLPLSASTARALHTKLVQSVIAPSFPLAIQDETDGQRSCVIHHNGRQSDYRAIDLIVDRFHEVGSAFVIDNPRPIVATRRNPEPRRVFPSAYRSEASRC